MSAPLLKSSEKAKKPKDDLQPFKPVKPKIGKASAKHLVEFKGDLSKQQILWIERWMTQLVQERSLPPQIAGADAFAALAQILAPADCLAVLEKLREDFARAFPLSVPQKEDFAFLESAVAADTQLSLLIRSPPPALRPQPYQSGDESPE